MKHNIYRSQLIKIVFVSLVCFIACNEFDEPGLINEPTMIYAQDPVINGIQPSGSAVAGVREITILGSNFAGSNVDTNWVFIGGEAANIKDVSENEIVVYRPVVYGDDIDISVVVPNALGVAKASDYKIEEAIEDFGDFTREPFDLMAIAVDENENLYVASRRRVLQLSSDGIDLIQIASLSSRFAKITDMKFGPGGLLYTAVSRREFYTIDVNTGEATEIHKFSKNTDKFDFDVNGNIYSGRRDGIFVLKPDFTETETGLYDGISIREIRVFNNYLYVATAKKLSRNQILDSNGLLGSEEVVADLETDSEFSNTEFNSFNFDIDGMIVLAIQGHSDYSLFVFEGDGSIMPYYQAHILPRSIEQIIYGRGRYMYLNRGSLDTDSVRVYRMGMEKIGAPYNGRQ